MSEALKSLFRKHICQTSHFPAELTVSRARGCEIFDLSGERFLDCISGIAVANVGHNHPRVVDAIKAQAERYGHVMVYGEYILEPQVRLAVELAETMPGDLSVTFFANSGAEAVEGALKTAKKRTGRKEILSFYNSYHGDTIGALSVMGNEEYRRPFFPLLPDVRFFDFNRPEVLEAITDRTAAVIIEPIQGEAGVRIADTSFLKNLRARCAQQGTLLIFDEVQSGFGRTGKMFAAQQFGVIPDLLVMAKAMGGGLPLGGFAGPPGIMEVLSIDPPFSHVTTMGGNPISCAAGLTALRVIREENLCENAQKMGELLRERIMKIPSGGKIIDVRGMGLLMAIEFRTPELAEKCVKEALKNHIILGGMLLAPACVRLAPPLIISDNECDEIVKTLEKIMPSLY